jgi:hypothetical protein
MIVLRRAGLLNIGVLYRCSGLMVGGAAKGFEIVGRVFFCEQKNQKTFQ